MIGLIALMVVYAICVVLLLIFVGLGPEGTEEKVIVTEKDGDITVQVGCEYYHFSSELLARRFVESL